MNSDHEYSRRLKLVVKCERTFFVHRPLHFWTPKSEVKAKYATDLEGYVLRQSRIPTGLNASLEQRWF